MTPLCDTNIISELCKSQPDPGVAAWSADVTTIAISVITLEEIIYGLSAKPNAPNSELVSGIFKSLLPGASHHSRDGSMRGGTARKASETRNYPNPS